MKVGWVGWEPGFVLRAKEAQREREGKAVWGTPLEEICITFAWISLHFNDPNFGTCKFWCSRGERNPL